MYLNPVKQVALAIVVFTGFGGSGAADDDGGVEVSGWFVEEPAPGATTAPGDYAEPVNNTGGDSGGGGRINPFLEAFLNLPPIDNEFDRIALGITGMNLVAAGACTVQSEQTLHCSNIAANPGQAGAVRPPIPEVVRADQITVAPQRPTLSTEPATVGVVGRAENFVAQAAEHTVPGTLLGYAIEVRFTPANYTFDYGDGTTGTASSGGSSWESLGQPKYSETPTSHAYSKRGTYTASASVRFSAQVNFGDGQWRDVIGMIPATSDGRSIRIYEPKTALTETTCEQDVNATGC